MVLDFVPSLRVGVRKLMICLSDPFTTRADLLKKKGEEFAKENADVAVRYVKDFLSPDLVDEADIPRGEGRIVRHGIHKIAAYRDDSGRSITAPPSARTSSASSSGTRPRRAGTALAMARASIPMVRS